MLEPNHSQDLSTAHNISKLSSAGHILDMIKRLRQNKSLRPSNRQKFRADNRNTIYSDIKTEKKVSFGKFSVDQINAAKTKIRKEARLKNLNDFRLFLICLVVAFIFLYLFYISV